MFREEDDCQQFLTNPLISAIFKIEALEKENTELKSNDCWKECLYASGKSELIHEILQQQYNLTKAKEIIEGLMRFCRCFAQHHTDDIRYKEAEQFLSEVEK